METYDYPFLGYTFCSIPAVCRCSVFSSEQPATSGATGPPGCGTGMPVIFVCNSTVSLKTPTMHAERYIFSVTALTFSTFQYHVTCVDDFSLILLADNVILVRRSS
jgi:hypothetical protein